MNKSKSAPTARDADGYTVEPVWSSNPDETGENEESMRLWVWFATKQAGGKVVMSSDDFFRVPGNAVLRWKMDPNTLAVTFEAGCCEGAV